MPRFRIRLAAVAICLAACSAFVATPASADVADASRSSEFDQSSTGSAPSDRICVSYATASACFKKYGDQIWVRDTEWSEHPQAIGEWENWLFDGSQWNLYRKGYCYRLYETDWGVCNKDFYEDTTTNYFGGQGSRIYWRACSFDGCSAWTNVRNDG